MKIIIEVTPDKDPERTLDYFYEKCSDLIILSEIEHFKINIEGTDLKRIR